MRKAGKGRTRGCISVYVKDNGTGSDRIGITISHREGNSVVRHTFVRRMREIFREYEKGASSSNIIRASEGSSYAERESSQKAGRDIVVVARNGAGNASYEELKALFLTGLK